MLKVISCVSGVADPSVVVKASKGGTREIIGPAFGGNALTFMLTGIVSGAPTVEKIVIVPL